MRKFVLDTNLFFNMEPGMGMGKKTEEVVIAVTQSIKKKKKEKLGEFFMPPRVVDELLSFFDDKEQKFLKEFLAEIHVKSPEITNISFPSTVFYELVQDVRERNYKGITIAQEEVEEAAKTMNGGKEEGKKEYQIKIGPVIKSLRDRYRQATRTGFLDSVADLDLIVLAKEQGAAVVSTDEGVLIWARKFGATEMQAAAFGQWMLEE